MFSPLCVPDEPDPQMTMFDLLDGMMAELGGLEWRETLAQQYRDLQGAEEWVIWLAVTCRKIQEEMMRISHIENTLLSLIGIDGDNQAV